MNQISRCDWLPERARWSHLARSGLPAGSRKQNFTKSHIINTYIHKCVNARYMVRCTVCTSSCRLSKCSKSYYRISWKFCWETLIEPHYLAQHPPTIYLGHLDELQCVSTAAVICGSDALQNQHSTYLRSTKQDVLFKQPQNSSPKRKRDTYRKWVKTSESLKCKLKSYDKN